MKHAAVPGVAISDDELERLHDDQRAAWLAYNAVQQDLPDCEHVREWKARIEQARKAHRAAIRAYDKAEQERRAAEPELEADEPPGLAAAGFEQMTLEGAA